MDLASTSSWRASRLDWLAFPANAGLVRRDAALRGGEIGGQGVGGQIRGAGQPRHLGLQRGDPRQIVGSDNRGRGVGRRVREGRVGRQDRGQLAGRDAGDFGGPPIVQDVPGDGRLE